ncbi:hypothetical protein Mro02_44350 [Microbispora rosea subsp. aerata]|nr:hypothetical protein Mro02_44350 [Microbispora rosea subsp. aerata]GLJ85491.1 hypothetical protein GCM10017588_42240 [Microbispora rosea subsp. aerata]
MLLVLALVAAWSVLIPGFMDWDDIVAAVIGSLRLTGPLGAAFAAWVAFRRRRAEQGRVLTPWRAARAPLSIIAVVTGSFGATVLLLGLRAALTDQGGPLLPGGLAMSVAGLGLYIVVGWILGWLVPVFVVPLIAGAGTFGLFTWLATGPHWADRLAPSTEEPYDLLMGVSETAYADQTLWLLGLSAALLLGWVALVTRRTLALAAAVIAVLAAGTGAARLVSRPHTMEVSERFICQEWPLNVCVRPEMRGGLAELVNVFTALATRLAGTPAAFERVEQRAYGEEEPARRGVVVIHLDNLGSGYAQRAAAEFLDRVARPCTGAVAAGYRAIVVSWLRGVPLPSGPLREHQDASWWFSTLTEEQRHDWLRMFYSDFVSCGLQAKHFGGGGRLAEPVAGGYPANPTPAYTPRYPLAPTYPGVAGATGAPSPAPGWERSPGQLGGGSGRGWAVPHPSVPAWPSPPAASPAGQDSTGSWHTPEGGRRDGRWAHDADRPRHPWRPGRIGRHGDAADPDRPGASPSPSPSAQGAGQGGENAPGRDRPSGQGNPGRPGGTAGNGGSGGNDDQNGHRAQPRRVPGSGAASGRVRGRDGAGRVPDRDGRGGQSRPGGSAQSTGHTRPASDDATGAHDANPQDDPTVADIPGALLIPAS